MLKFHHLFEYHAIDVNYTLIFILSDLHFSNLLCQSQKSHINNSFRIIVITISTAKANIANIYIKNTHFPLQENTALPESPLKQSILSSTYKAVNMCLIILLVTNQSGRNFNAVRQSSITSNVGRNISFWKRTFPNNSVTHFLSFLSIRKTNKCKKRYI